MAVSAQFLEFVLDQLAGVGALRWRRMFGGVGIYANDVFFALIDDDTLYLKVGDTNRDDYLARNCRQFRPYADDPSLAMSYFSPPEDVMEDADELRQWARRALEVAGSAASRKSRAAMPAERQQPSRVVRTRPGKKR